MPKITFIDSGGMETVIDAESGLSLMNNAVNHNITGVVAECGGACACATCLVHIEQSWYDKLPSPEDMEKDMLEFAAEKQEYSRLSCQIMVGDELEGLIVHTPVSQY